jgi:hypothetical protein
LNEFQLLSKNAGENSVDFLSFTSFYGNLPFSFGENLELADLTKMKDNNGRSRTPLSFINFLILLLTAEI